MQIKWIIDRFENECSISDRPNSGQQCICTEQLKGTVEEKLSATPTTPSRRLAQNIRVSHTKTYRVMHSITYPYKFTVCQELKPTDVPRCLAFCKWLLCFAQRGQTKFNLFYFSDEAWFHVSGYINCQNFRTWSSTNPHAYIESSLHPQKIGVWCGLSRTKIIGPLFFDSTINADRY